MFQRIFQDEKGNDVLVTAQDIMDKVGITRSTAYRRLEAARDLTEVFKKKAQHGDKVYTLDDGRTVTINSLRQVSGVNRNTLYRRLEVANMRNYEDLIQPGREEVEWKDDEVQVYGGIPMNPYYLDGRSVKNMEGEGVHAVDRYGKNMDNKHRTALMLYREKQRKEWLANRQGVSY